MAGSILAVPGLAATSEEFRAALLAMAERNGWDVDAIATVMSIESGFKASVQNPLPGQTASGLIQFTDSTARGLGVPNGAAGIRAMSATEQLVYVEKYYRRAFGTRVPRPVDFYLAGWGSGIGAAESHVLARATDERKFNGGADNAYTLNRGLDANGNGEITVGDIAAKMRTQQSYAKGRRLEVVASSGPLAPAPQAAEASSGSPSSSVRSLSLERLCASLPVVKLGASGPFVAVVEWFAGVSVTSGVVGVQTENAIRELQRKLTAQGLYAGKIDGECGPKTWRAIFSGEQ